MDSNNSQSKVKFGIAAKFVIGMIIIVLCITGAAIWVGADAYTNSTTQHYNTVAYQTAEAAKGYFTKEEMLYYSDLVTRYAYGQADESEIETARSSERYKEIWDYVDKLRKSMNANDIYICVFDLDVLESYNDEIFEAKQWFPAYYILDSYYNEELQFELGQKGDILPKYRFDFIEGIKTGVHSDNTIVSTGKYGHILTAAYPVVYDGKTVAFIDVEIPMLTLETDISNYVVRVLIVSGILMVVLLAVGITFVLLTVIKPIGVVAHEADKFVGENAEVSDKLDKIKTRDEIELLSRSLLRMEIDIKDYIENITKITAEKERIGAELNVATQIQADMLPSIFPAFPGRNEFDIYATMTPAKEVGGDFYDYFLIDDDHLAMVMADVSGKGVPAALFMVIAKTLIKNHAQLGELSPAKVLMSANEQLCEGNEAELFVTVWLAILELSTGKGKAANAGHEHPALRRKDGKFELVEYRHSPAVATMEGVRFKEHDFELHPGDSLFVYTDGVAEATNLNNELYGTERMINALNKNPDAAPKEMLTTVKSSVDEFVGAAPQFDDITMLGLTYFGSDKKD